MAIFIFNFITAHTSGHNFGPDALARKQCRARVLATLGRALGVGPFHRAPVTTPSPSEPGPSLYLRPLERYSSGARGGAAVIRASALGAPVNCKRYLSIPSLVAILAQKPPMLCPKRGTNHLAQKHSMPPCSCTENAVTFDHELSTHWSVWHHPSCWVRH
jgi:hypothetical protein